MAKYKVTTEKGTFIVTTEDAPAKESSLMDKAKGAYAAYKDSPLYKASPQGLLETSNNLMNKGYDLMGEKATEAIGTMKSFPKAAKPYQNEIAAGVGTAIQMIPPAVQALATPQSSRGKFPEQLGKQLESSSGAVPGSLSAAFKDPTLRTAPGKEAVKALYESAKSGSGGIRKELADVAGKKDFVEKAIELSGGKKSINPEEALAARQELDAIKKTVSATYYRQKREILDQIAKKAFSEADKAYQRGAMADSLRQLLPQNKYGGASSFKMGLVAPAFTTLGGLAGHFLGSAPIGTAIGTGMGAAALSPYIQGLAAETVGKTVPYAPKISVAASKVLENLARKRKRDGKKD